jgi:hypothetical protein
MHPQRPVSRRLSGVDQEDPNVASELEAPPASGETEPAEQNLAGRIQY